MEKKIRVLHMTPPIVKNGIYQYIFMLYKYIDKEHFAFDFLMQAPDELKKTEEYKKYHFGIRSFTTTQREDAERFRQEIYEILSDGYDILELHTSYWRGFMIEEIAMEIGIPKVIVHAHSAGLDNNNLVERIKQGRIHEKLKKEFGLQYATDFWACSKEAADWIFGDNIPKTRIRIIHNAIETENFQYNAVVRRKIRKELGIGDSFVIGHTGRFEFQKNHRFLVDVFQGVLQKGYDVKLLLVGEGQLKEEVEQYSKQIGIYDNILFLGWREDIADLLQAMDLYCLPSRFEGLPIVLVEAQSADLKCIVSDTVTLESQILDDYDSLPLNTQIWVEEIEKYIQAPKQRRKNSEQIRRAGFDMETAVKSIEKAYLER